VKQKSLGKYEQEPSGLGTTDTILLKYDMGLGFKTASHLVFNTLYITIVVVKVHYYEEERSRI
jgi:hypothetical protein